MAEYAWSATETWTLTSLFTVGRNMLSRCTLIFVTMAFLLGCETSVKPQGDPIYGEHLLSAVDIDDMQSSIDVQSLMTETADSVNRSLTKLARIEQATHPNAKLPPAPDPESVHMAEVASIDWNGPIEPLIRKIAKASGYRVRILGTAPAIPVLVSVNAKSLPLADILRDMTYQAEHHASVVLYAKQRVIELRYPGA